MLSVIWLGHSVFEFLGTGFAGYPNDINAYVTECYRFSQHGAVLDDVINRSEDSGLVQSMRAQDQHACDLAHANPAVIANARQQLSNSQVQWWWGIAPGAAAVAALPVIGWFLLLGLVRIGVWIVRGFEVG